MNKEKLLEHLKNIYYGYKLTDYSIDIIKILINKIENGEFDNE
ncbi:hypothetical protein [Spiroplasma ixodetis]|nr:hypothetical protein [Spiroplasma ixodetis]WJG69446.1 hypothetical protein SIXOD_v1c03130 [Spiroplasma ixodetis Y32]WJG69474.1 hypothetical protein SIXOD_v1c03410 [Spiroplasma ixodetis Y32]WJG69880.1 hypothetical protein SIXOD_v1c08670 [Spiroplasma ixodetis Y32]WJG70303.1 hypothetical protein SIXOD_v1c14020 [Spiroplasma ixodetis Y32]WJG70975.1 hypothetical protein SIXOD_v1c22770 [Spiroplasma ixodetis Y32]